MNHPSQFQEPADSVLRNLAFKVVSDQHFFHRNIQTYGERPANHERLMRERWLERVTPSDTVLNLGDLVFKGPSQARYLEEVAPLLPGRLFLIKGNHDKCPTAWYREAGYQVIQPFAVEYRGYTVYFTHRPGGDWKPFEDPLRLVRGSDPKLNVHGHVHQRSHPDPRLINLSVEVTDYAPVRIKDVLDERIRLLES